MKTIEHRRHAKRTKPSPHINSEGVATARRLGDTYSGRPFDLVVTSTKRRAIQTAVAMGFAVDRTEELLAEIPEALNEIMAWDSGFKELSKALETDEANRWLRKLRTLYLELLEQIPDGGKILVVSHGGVVEWSTLACLGAPAAELGAPIGLCEGVSLTWASGKWTDAQELRQPFRK